MIAIILKNGNEIISGANDKLEALNRVIKNGIAFEEISFIGYVDTINGGYCNTETINY